MDGQWAEYWVCIKPSAIEATPSLADRATAGELLPFPSRTSAETYAMSLSAARDVDLQIQAAAPQDPTAADGYLVAGTGRDATTPLRATGSEYEFPVTGNLYGRLGELAVCTPAETPPVLRAYISDDLEATHEGMTPTVHVERSPEPVVASVAGDRKRWAPDCRAIAEIEGRTVREYYCEIKAGDGSVERAQRTVMEVQARRHPVLLIRVDLDNLPARYSAKITDISGAEPSVGTIVGEQSTQLSDYLNGP